MLIYDVRKLFTTLEKGQKERKRSGVGVHSVIKNSICFKFKATIMFVTFSRIFKMVNAINSVKRKFSRVAQEISSNFRQLLSNVGI